MVTDDIEFTIADSVDKELKCKIISFLPSNNDEGYAVFIEKDIAPGQEIIFQYGKICRIGDSLELHQINNEVIISRLKEKLYDDIVTAANMIMEGKYE